MNIIVLAGGTSTERDISIVTSTMVCKALRRNGHNAAVIDVFFGYEKKYDDVMEVFKKNNDLDELAADLKVKTESISLIVKQRETLNQGFFGPHVLELCKASDIVFMGLHGANGEDGKIQGAFDLMGIKYTGTGYLSSAISMNKALTKNVLVSAGIPMPKGISVWKGDPAPTGLTYPCVVKPCCGGSSVGVYIVNNNDEYNAAVEEAFKLEDHLLVEEYVKSREFSVAVIEGRALPVIEIAPVSGFYDYKNKYIPGMTKDTCPAELPTEISDKMKYWAEKSCEAVGLETYGRVDVLLNDKNEMFCLEINTLPGMTPTSLIPQEAQVEGMSYDELCERLIDISMKKYR